MASKSKGLFQFVKETKNEIKKITWPSKEEVKKAYIKDQKIDEDELAYCSIDYPNVDEGYYGDRWCFILFCFGEDDTVISMAMQPPGFWVW